MWNGLSTEGCGKAGVEKQINILSNPWDGFRNGGEGMRVLVTGATGFLGRRLVSALARQGHDLRVLIRGRNTGLDVPGAEVQIARGDIQDRAVASFIRASVTF